MVRQGMMLSALNEAMLGRFRHMFYRRAGIPKDRRVVIHSLGSIVAYGKRGSSFDQQLGGGFAMVFRHYCLKADKKEPGKYDHIIYVDIVPEKPKFIDEARQRTYDLRGTIAADVTEEIEAYLAATGLAIEIRIEDSGPMKQHAPPTSLR